MVLPTSNDTAENIRTKRYRFASAEYDPNGVDRETGNNIGALLSAIALTNEPFLTKLPEATLLAKMPEVFYLDFKEETKNMGLGKVEETLNKLSETMAGFINSFKGSAAQVASPVVDEATKQKLAEMETAQKVNTEALAKLAEQLAQSEKGRQLAEVEKDVSAMVAAGIPPAMAAQWKEIALSLSGTAVIKLAGTDGKEVETTAANAFKNTLLALPEEHRIPHGQRGTQAAADELDKIKLACDEDIKMLGGEVTAEGKYKI